MKIQSIEPTPSPNTMKVLLDEELPFGTSYNYKPAQAAHAPAIIQQLLQIEGVKGIYHVADFLAIERHAKYDWKPILTKVREVFGEQVEELQDNEPVRNDHFGEVKVYRYGACHAQNLHSDRCRGRSASVLYRSARF